MKGIDNFVLVTPQDHRREARRRLPGFIFDYIDGGANDERTLLANEQDFAALRLRQRVLRNVEQLDSSAVLAGQASALPLALAPVGMAGMFARRGEVQALRAANAVGVPFTLSTVGICPLEELQAEATQPFWFQLYMIRDREAVRQLLTRAWQMGCRTLLFTVDLPVAGLRHRDTRQGLMDGGLYSRLARGCQILSRPAWVWDVGIRGRPHRFGNLADRVPNPDDLDAFKRWLDAQFDPRTSWDDIQWLRDTWQGTLLLKGVQEVEDGEQAACLGVDGLVVSNHGGRQLDSVASSITKLPAMVDAVGRRLDVFMDGGVRSGIDVFKAVALGAKGVLIGRPWAWALAAQGQRGVQALLSTFLGEFRVAMALAGVRTVAEIGRMHLDGDLDQG